MNRTTLGPMPQTCLDPLEVLLRADGLCRVRSKSDPSKNITDRTKLHQKNWWIGQIESNLIQLFEIYKFVIQFDPNSEWIELTQRTKLKLPPL